MGSAPWALDHVPCILGIALATLHGRDRLLSIASSVPGNRIVGIASWASYREHRIVGVDENLLKAGGVIDNIQESYRALVRLLLGTCMVNRFKVLF